MEITIRELNWHNLQDADLCEGAFTVDARLVLSAEDGIVHYNIVSTSPYQKRYPVDRIDFTTYIGNPDKTVYLAYVDGKVAGQIRLCRYWNGYAYVNDIVVDSHFFAADHGHPAHFTGI